MNQTILDRIQALGGDISQVKGKSLAEDLMSITFDMVLYPKPEDTPWADEEDQEPIYGLGEYIDEHQELIQSDRQAFMDKMIAHYYVHTEEGRDRCFGQQLLLHPIRKELMIMKSGIQILWMRILLI